MFNFFKNKNKTATKPKNTTNAHYVVVGPKNYAAAEQNRLTYSWTNYKYTSDQIIKKYYKPLVARSCEQCMNNPYMIKFLSLLENNVIGDTGIALQAQAKDPSGQLDTIANDAHEAAWKKWQKKKNCDITNKLNFIGMCKLAIKTVAREGECLIHIVTGKDAGPWGFALQLIDPRQLDVDKNEDNLADGHFIRFGIEFNKYGKPLKYFLKTREDGYYQQIGQPYNEIKAENLIHLFIPQYINQKRGIPWLSGILMRSNMLNGFEEAAVEHARVGACQMGFITSNDPDEYEGEDEEEETMIQAAPASFHKLPPGYDVKKFDPAYPNGEFDAFSKSILRSISAGLNVGYADLTGDLTQVNFSSLRHGVIDTREVWKGLQEWFKSSFVEEVHEAWLKYSLLAGKISCGSGYLKPERIDKYREVTWTMRRWQWVDPVKDVNSAAISVANGFRSRSNVIREQGYDPDEVWAEIEKENATLRQKDILVKNEVVRDVGDEDNEEQTTTKK